jgi:arylsulfatase A-like enzyme
MITKIKRLLFILIFGLFLSYSNQKEETNKGTSDKLPNIILILADDMGYGDIQAYNPASGIPTTNLNSLAEEGMRFLDAHTNSSVCSPTRYGILTGRYAWRTRLKSGVLFEPGSKPLIQPERLTLPKMLKKYNYHTACFGKWHLGIEWDRDEEDKADFNRPFLSGPNEVGFDYYFGVTGSLDMIPYTFYENNRPVQPVTETQPHLDFPRYLREGPRAKGFDHSKALDRLTEKSVEYVKEQSGSENPFFLYFALTAPHKPVWPAERFQGRTELGPYADLVLQVDWTVGQILAALEEQEIKDNTLIIFTSDNGSFMFRVDADQKYPFGKILPKQSFKARKVGDGQKDHADDSRIHGYYPFVHRANYIWRGTKADIWEAGHRVPFIVKWPGHIKEGTKNSQTICVTDIMKTCADIVGYSLTEKEGEDSFSLMPLFLGEQSKISRAPVVHHSSGGMFAIREGKWKMVFGNGSGGRQVPRGKPFKKPYILYNMKNDPAETTNLISQYPKVANKLSDQLDSIRYNKALK